MMQSALITEHLTALLSLAWLLWIVLLGVGLILERRSPAATLAWLLAVSYTHLPLPPAIQSSLLRDFLFNQRFESLPVLIIFTLEFSQQGAGRSITTSIRMIHRAADRTRRSGFKIFPQGFNIPGASCFGSFQRLFSLFQPGGSHRLFRQQLR